MIYELDLREGIGVKELEHELQMLEDQTLMWVEKRDRFDLLRKPHVKTVYQEALDLDYALILDTLAYFRKKQTLVRKRIKEIKEGQKLQREAFKEHVKQMIHHMYEMDHLWEDEFVDLEVYQGVFKESFEEVIARLEHLIPAVDENNGED